MAATQVVAETMAGNLDQRPAFGRKSLECDSMLIRPEGHLGELSCDVEAINDWLQT